MSKLRERVIVEMFDRIKETLRPEPGLEAELRRIEQMIGTLKLMVESLECDAADPKIERQIRRLRKDIRQWEKRKGECEMRLEKPAV